jgi:transposase InsO family protein
MEFVLHPWHLLVLTLSALIEHEQEKAIEYLKTENQVIREKLGKGRIMLNDDQRRRLAVKGKYLGRKALFELATIVTPDTVLRWHRQLIAMKWDYSDRRQIQVGRPRIREVIVHLIVRMATNNEGWGYDRMQGALKNLGYYISDATVGNLLKEHGIEPAPDREKKTTWSKFLKAHWEVMGAVDFTTVEVWTRSGLTTFYILVVMKLSTRRIEIAGITPNPDAAWVQQMGRNLTDCYDGFLLDTKYLLIDRDTKFCPLRGVLEGTDTEAVLLPARSPNLNAYIERYMRSMKDECLNKMIFLGEKSLRRALAEFEEHYHTERNHQGLGNNIIDFKEEAGLSTGSVQCRERLGGMLSYYYRDAA